MTQITRANAGDVQAWRRERFDVTIGYAVGIIHGGAWLTILGSHWETIPLFSTAELAEEWHAARWTNPPTGRPFVTRLVERVGNYFRIRPA